MEKQDIFKLRKNKAYKNLVSYGKYGVVLGAAVMTLGAASTAFANTDAGTSDLAEVVTPPAEPPVSELPPAESNPNPLVDGGDETETADENLTLLSLSNGDATNPAIGSDESTVPTYDINVPDTGEIINVDLRNYLSEEQVAMVENTEATISDSAELNGFFDKLIDGIVDEDSNGRLDGFLKWHDTPVSTEEEARNIEGVDTGVNWYVSGTLVEGLRVTRYFELTSKTGDVLAAFGLTFVRKQE